MMLVTAELASSAGSSVVAQTPNGLARGAKVSRLTLNSWAIDASDGSQSLETISPDSICARIAAAA